ncbi:hypothetical protein ACSXAS_15310 (plasmid) [Clostridium perfringens]|uniref:hypothetical protein n=1 Tax=Clostridium perfringens TaxID=1502 RepID=UPI0022477D78|nr:hypothetical protein [Clostridium perfringens]MCX0386745.1 hypothetical protein [Clostridium perfringens]
MLVMKSINNEFVILKSIKLGHSKWGIKLIKNDNENILMKDKEVIEFLDFDCCKTFIKKYI